MFDVRPRAGVPDWRAVLALMNDQFKAVLRDARPKMIATCDLVVTAPGAFDGPSDVGSVTVVLRCCTRLQMHEPERWHTFSREARVPFGIRSGGSDFASEMNSEVYFAFRSVLSAAGITRPAFRIGTRARAPRVVVVVK